MSDCSGPLLSCSPASLGSCKDRYQFIGVHYFIKYSTIDVRGKFEIAGNSRQPSARGTNICRGQRAYTYAYMHAYPRAPRGMYGADRVVHGDLRMRAQDKVRGLLLPGVHARARTLAALWLRLSPPHAWGDP